MTQPAARPDDLFLTLHSPDGGLSLELCPSVGGCVTAFRRNATGGGQAADIFRAYDRSLPLSPLNFGSFPLVPFSNRIDNGRLTFRGETFDVGPKFRDEAHPNHGNGWMLPWTVAEAGPRRAVLTLTTAPDKDTPYGYEAEQIFSLENGALVVDIAITNRSGRALPFGTGHHAYFNRTEGVTLRADLKKVWTSVNMMPDRLVDLPAPWNFPAGVDLSAKALGEPRSGADGSAYIDHCFQGWDGTAEITWPETGTKMVMTADPLFANFVVFVPQDNFFCAEPVTNVTDGFNLMEKGVPDTGAVVLADGETLKGRTRFAVMALG